MEKGKVIFKFGYCRKSTESDERQIQSIESQTTWIMGITGENFQDLKLFTESKSAKDPYKRLEFQKLIKEIENINKKYKGKIDFEIWIYSWGLDRLSRNPVDSGILQYKMQKGEIHQIICCDRTFTQIDSGIMMGLFNALNNQFILDLQKNTKRGTRDKANKGGCIQLTPNGYINNKETKEAEVDEKLKPIVKEIFKLRDKGYSYRGLVSYCKEKCYKTKKGSNFTKTTIENMLKNPFYIGFQKNEGILKKGNHEVFIDIDVWNRINGVEKKGFIRRNIDEFPLKGIIKNLNTGKNLLGIVKNKKIKSTGEYKKYVYYCTHNTEKENKVSISQEEIIKLYDNLIPIYEINSEIKPIILDILKKNFAKYYEKLEEERKFINLHITEANKKLKRLFDLVCSGTISDERYKEENNKTTLELENYKEQLEKISEKDLNLNEESLFFVELIENLSLKWKTWDNSKKLKFIKIMTVELRLDNKKELHIQESKLFELIKVLNIKIGTGEGT